MFLVQAIECGKHISSYRNITGNEPDLHIISSAVHINTTAKS